MRESITRFTDNVSVAVGAENLFDKYPDEAVFQASARSRLLAQLAVRHGWRSPTLSPPERVVLMDEHQPLGAKPLLAPGFARRGTRSRRTCQRRR